jgi:hypothetical protein
VRGHPVAQLVEAQRYKPEGRVFNSRWCHGNNSLTHGDSGVDSSSIRNEWKEYFLRVKAAGVLTCQTYHFHVPMVMKSGNLKILDPSGPVRACKGVDLYLFVDM